MHGESFQCLQLCRRRDEIRERNRSAQEAGIQVKQKQVNMLQKYKEEQNKIYIDRIERERLESDERRRLEEENRPDPKTVRFNITRVLKNEADLS